MVLSMKKRSQSWNQFGQLIDIVGLKISRKQREIKKLKNKSLECEQKIKNKWDDIKRYQTEMSTLKIADEERAVARYFAKIDATKRDIEDLFMEATLAQKELKKIQEEMATLSSESARLAKRKDALNEVRAEL